jgi:hypothetical protein
MTSGAVDAVTNRRIGSTMRRAVLDRNAQTHYIPSVAKVSKSVVVDHAKAASHIL